MPTSTLELRAVQTISSAHPSTNVGSSSAAATTSFAFNPLTTTFTAPADCTGVYEDDLFRLGPGKSCLPPNAPLESTAFFSPGIACPAGYVSACHDTTGVASITTVTCCPTRDDITLSCANSGISNVWSTLFCTWIAPSLTSIDVTASGNGVTSTTAATLSSPGGLNAYGVRMLYESTDLTSSTSSTSSSTQPTSSSSSSGASSSASTTLTIPSATSSPSSMSSGAKIGIGVAIPVLILAILAGVFFWWRRRRQYGVVGKGPPVPTAELHNETRKNELSAEAKLGELPGQMHEGPIRAQELHNDGMPCELPSEHER